MDPVSSAVIKAVSAGLDSVAVKDIYHSLKQAVEMKLGIGQIINDLEKDPRSKTRQQRLEHELTSHHADKDQEIVTLANQLIGALQAAEPGSVDQAKHQIDDTGANVQMHILHLSDLHFGTQEDATRWHGQLADDLKHGLKCDRLDAMFICGDVANFAVEDEYDAAGLFIDRVCEEFQIPSDNCVIVPGNHDLNWELSEDGYIPVKRKKHKTSLKEGAYIDESDAIIQIRDDTLYQERFSPFCDFYQKAIGKPYPTAHKMQGMIYHLQDLGLLILGLNSAWQVDHHFRSRAGICPDALSAALDTIRRNPAFGDCLKFAVWHHPLNSPFEDRIVDHGFMERLAQNGFSVCFHGHLHRTKNELFRYDHSAGGRKIEIVGAGTFGAPVKEWYSGYPLQYNLLRICSRKIIVETRRRNEINGAWKPDAIWSQGEGKDPLPRYTIDLDRRPTKPIKSPIKTTSPPAETVVVIDREFEDAIQAYCDSARSLYETLPLMGFRTKLRVPIRIEDIYVPLRAMLDLRATGDCRFADAEDAEKKLGREASEEFSLPEAFGRAEARNRRGIVILGDPGSGKTTHLKRLLLWCLDKGQEKVGLGKEMIPVFLPLRELRDLDQGLDAFIQDQLDKPHLGTPDGFGKRLVAQGNLLFLLDGLDEVADPEQRARVARWIDEAVRVRSNNCRFVVTCRFAGYTDQARLCEHFLEMHLRPLSWEQVKTFVGNWYRIVETGLSSDAPQAEVIAKEKSRDLVERLDKPEFRARRVFELTRNPLLLTNICLVHRDRGNLPHSRDRLYEECTDVLLELWRAAIGYQTRVDGRSGRQVLQPAALWMHQEENRTRARADELAPVIEPPLKSVVWPHGKAEDFLRVVRDESGLLTGWGQEEYGFMHLGFQEYLAALEIQNRYVLDPKLLDELVDRFGQSWWQEVILLLLSLNNPCLFVPFMRILTQQPGFTKHQDLVQMCLDDAAEKPILPFIELLQQEDGKDPAHWQRQLAALKLVERLENDALNGLISQLAKHPFDKIRERVGQRTAKAEQDIIHAPRGGYELVKIPEGEFLMGSPESEEDRFDLEGPQHTVRVPEFFMGRYPVTNEEFGRFLADNPEASEPEYWGDREYNQPNQPVVGVSWEDAVRYARWAGLQLPSEAQWEYGCRAGTAMRFYSGDSEKDLDRVGWYAENSDDRLHPVGEKEPNKFGLYDMHGNIWEWVEDDWHDSYKGAPVDGSAWIDEQRGSCRVFRGGGWDFSAWHCRSACRYWGGPGGRGCSLGFRLVLLPGQSG